MQHRILTPFPTLAEVIRVIVNALDVKSAGNAKRLDDEASRIDMDSRDIDKFIKESISDPVKRYAGEEIAKVITDSVIQLFDNYRAVVGSVCLDGVSRTKSLPLLLEHLFPQFAADFLDKLCRLVGGPSPSSLVSIHERSVKVVFDWIENNQPALVVFHKTMEKESKDKISSWKRGDSLPSSQHIALEFRDDEKYALDFSLIRSLLIIARAIDFARQDVNGILLIESIRIYLLSGQNSDFNDKAKSVIVTESVKYSNTLALAAKIQTMLKRTCKKNSGSQQDLRDDLDNLRAFMNEVDPEGNNSYWVDWHDARWHVFSGDLQAAVDLYKKAFFGCLYRSGENQKMIIEESMVIASSLNKPDKVFLRKLKNMQITLGFDVLEKTGDASGKKTIFSDIMEDWEVKIWAGRFPWYFPKEGYFEGMDYLDRKPTMGPLVYLSDKEVEPDYRHPDRVIKIGDTWKKSYPQLVYFCDFENKAVVKKLLEKGANVNVFSDSGDSPILMALESLNIFEMEQYYPHGQLRSLDKSLFDLIASHEHKPETLNRRADKKQMLPLISAVNSGRPEIVRKILDMGADPNGRGLADRITALHVCLRNIEIIKNPQKFAARFVSLNNTEELQREIRRRSNGVFGASLDDNEAYIELMNNPESGLSRHRVREYAQALKPFLERVSQCCSIAALREIGRILLDYGANPNAFPEGPAPRCTPLMVAAELDERMLFDFMLIKNGNPSYSYVHPGNGSLVDCWDIAGFFRSKDVLLSLDAVKSHFKPTTFH